MSAPSRTQLDQTGERIRDGKATPEDWDVLTEYRLSVRDATTPLLNQVRELAGQSSYPFTERLKTNYAIVQKLRRTSIRLRQMDDVMGCRIIVANQLAQDAFSAKVAALSNAKIRDRRANPSNGYHAVHVILGTQPYLEVQVRTGFQDAWAQLSERLSDQYGIEVKYGGGPSHLFFEMLHLGAYIEVIEENQKFSVELGLPPGDTADEVKHLIDSIRKKLL